MKEVEIANLESYIKFINDNCSLSTLYRGVNDASYELIPSIGRVPGDADTKEEILKTLLINEKKRNARV